MSRRRLHLSDDLSMPVDAVARTFAVLGQRGTGKTSTAVVLVEEMAAAGGQVAIVDPTGAWWGVASSADGKGPGVPVVVFGGHHGDVPLEETAGQLVADLIVQGGYNVVLDLELLRKGAQIRFMADFAEALYHHNRDALHLVVDEADRFAPQTLRGGDVAAARALGGLEDIVKLGRRKGLGCTLVTQRPATLNKNVLEQAETLIAHRLVGPRDRKAIAEWFEAQGDPGAEKEALAAIAKLSRGTAYLFSPSFLRLFEQVHVRKKRTFDSSATPEVGAKRSREPTGRADVDLDQLRGRMAETIERAKADDPKALRRRIKELEAQLAARPAEQVEVPVEVEIEVLTDDDRDLLRQVAAIETALPQEDVDRLEQAAALARDVLERTAEHPPTPALAAPRAPERRPPAPAARPAAPPATSASGDGPELGRAPRTLLATLVSLAPRRLSRAELSTLSGYKPRSSTYRNALSSLRTAGYLDEHGGTFAPTQAGFEYAGADGPPEPMGTDELLTMWYGALGKASREMLGALVEAHPDPLTRDDVAERTGYSLTSSTFRNGLSALRSNGLLEDIPGGDLRASDSLFIGAAR